MPIRMEKDPQKDQPREPRRDDNQNRGGGGIGGLMNYIPFVLMFVFKKPKLLVPILVIGGLLYFFGFFGSGGGGGMEGDYSDMDVSQFTFGAELSEEKFDKAEVFEPLSSGYGNPAMPPAVSLAHYAPPRLHQGRQGSCVGWASSYAARTILHSRATGRKGADVAFSPSYLYNQIALQGCQGAYMLDAMKSLHQGGTLPFQQYPYDDGSCSDQPNRTEMQKASQFRIKGYNRLTQGASNYRPDVNAIRQNLAQGAPVVIGMQVGGTFMHGMMGRKVWRPTQRDYSQYGFSGHAMCVIGYDDNLDGGSFQIMNSWGKEWGENGIGWVRYKDFDFFVKEAYGMYPMGSANVEKYDPNKLAVMFGLVDNETQQLIPLRKTGRNIFRTTSPVSVGQKFKVAVTNSIECYVYVFGQETDGSSYVLFPYTQKHSAYCGITGTRVFPRDYSMLPDDIGSTDRIAVVVSKEPIDTRQVNTVMSSSRQRTYHGKLDLALGLSQVEDVEFVTEDAIGFSTELNGKNAVGFVIEVDKR